MRTLNHYIESSLYDNAYKHPQRHKERQPETSPTNPYHNTIGNIYS